MILNAFIIALVTVLPVSVFASDIAREMRLAEQIVDAIIDGEAVYLPVISNAPKMKDLTDFEFLSIYTESENSKIKGAAIILHGRGFHPNWPDVVNPIRVGLLEYGWNTLSMQMPVLDKQAKYYDYLPVFEGSFPRIEAGIRYLKAQGNSRIVLIAHSCSVHMTMAWFERSRFKNIDAYVGIGMGATDYKQPMKKPFPLDEVDIPLLDVYGANEYPAVIRGAADRLKLIKRSGTKRSTQLVIPDADHYFRGRGESLAAVIANWLDTLER